MSMVKQLNEIYEKLDSSVVELSTFQELLRSELGAIPKRIEVNVEMLKIGRFV